METRDDIVNGVRMLMRYPIQIIGVYGIMLGVAGIIANHSDTIVRGFIIWLVSKMLQDASYYLSQETYRKRKKRRDK